jgi:hypothetical protein
MKHVKHLFIDMILDIIEGLNRLKNLFRKKPQPSLIASNVFWLTDSEWMERLVAYKQLELWTHDK